MRSIKSGDFFCLLMAFPCRAPLKLTVHTAQGSSWTAPARSRPVHKGEGGKEVWLPLSPDSYIS